MGGRDVLGGEVRVGGLDGAARGTLRVFGTDRVVGRGGLTVREDPEVRGGVTVRVGVRRSRLPVEGFVVRPDPTVP